MSRQTAFAFCSTVVEGEFRVCIERTLRATRAYGQEKCQKNEDPTVAHQDPFHSLLADASGKQIHLHSSNSILESDKELQCPRRRDGAQVVTKRM